LHPQLAHFPHLFGHVLEGLRMNARPVRAAQSYPAEFEENPTIPGLDACFHICTRTADIGARCNILKIRGQSNIRIFDERNLPGEAALTRCLPMSK
jgi:hypothetical protein